MQTKCTTENIDSTSALDRLSKLASRLDWLTSDTQDARCAAEIATNHIVGILFPGRKASDNTKAAWANEYYHIDERELRHIDFMTNDMVERATRADRLATELSGELLKLSKEMRHAAIIKKASDLEDCIAAWQAAYDAWIATGLDGVVPYDTPQADAEDEALLALASWPCVSLEDIQQKTNLFLNSKYLSGMASDHALDLLQSFSFGEAA